jgi:hypothetical protein
MRFLEIHRMISQNLIESQTIAFDSDGRIGVDTYQRGLARPGSTVLRRQVIGTVSAKPCCGTRL